MVHILTSPIPEIHAFTIAGIGHTIGKRHIIAVLVAHRIRVEIVVHVHAVNIVALHDIHDDGKRVIGDFRRPGVHPALSPVGMHRVGKPIGYVVCSQRIGGRRMTGPVRIEPDVQVKSSPMGLLNGKGQRVVGRIWGHAILASQIVGPGLQGALIQGVGRGTDLKDDRIEPQHPDPIQDIDQFRLLLVGGYSRLGRPVDIGHGSHPDGTELTVDVRQDGTYLLNTPGLSGDRKRPGGCACRKEDGQYERQQQGPEEANHTV